MKVLIFGDTIGIPQLLRHLPDDCICGIVAAIIRPQYIDSLRTLATDHNISFYIQPKHQSKEYPDFIKLIKKTGSDAFIVNSYSMKLHHDLLSIPKGYKINIHGGLLPQYQGANPIQWSMINKENKAGVTMHLMTEEIDGGDIVAQKSVDICFEDTWIDVHNKIIQATESILSETIPLFLQGNLKTTPQDETKARYWPRRKPEDGMIDWNLPAEDIYNLIRALVAPMPGAYYIENGEKVVINKFHTLDKVRKLKEIHQTK